MASTGPLTSEPRRFSIRPPRPIWIGLATVVLVIRRCVDHATGKSSDEVRYFLSSLPAKVKRLAGAVRQHWGIENGLHWVLDVAFHEDRMRQRVQHCIG